ncbi:uncharacterized protein LOC118200214 isoform X1 [Stegodyphus dumicola]|uniref:uncharacterized protein LOC118200214 isoform X1 n=1 Tax=Stegodyphus dumicola TaxID=202533 RepID=UPI0015AFCEC1|nr:uncharacterized protein LOC118200214 isoform X1 [Stegodyphus dumicola]
MNFAKSWSEFKEILRRHEVETVTKYVYYYGKSFDKEIELTPDLRLNWLDDIPYFHFGRKTYVCHQGKDLNKRQKENYAKEKNEKCQTDHAFGKAYSKNQTTKKVNCPAVINVTRMYRMPQFKVEVYLTFCSKMVLVILENFFLRKKYNSVTYEQDVLKVFYDKVYILFDIKTKGIFRVTM